MVRIVDNALSGTEVSALLDWFHGISDGELPDDRGYYKVKNPSRNDSHFPQQLDEIISRFIDYDHDYDGSIWACQSMDWAIRLHADVGPDIEHWGNVILIPLHVQSKAQTVFFDNHYIGTEGGFFTKQDATPYSLSLKDCHGHWTFVRDIRLLDHLASKGNDLIRLHGRTFTNDDSFRKIIKSRLKIDFTADMITDYSCISNWQAGRAFDKDVWQQYVRHVPIEDLDGLVIDKIVKWKPGQAYVFDRSQLHCASSNHSSKIGITIWINRKKHANGS